MKKILLALCVVLNWPASAESDLKVPVMWTVQTSQVDARLRGVSAVDEHIIWASGSDNTVLRTADGGAHWTRLAVADAMDFRDIKAIDAHTAYLLSIGEASASRIYKTADAGAHWTLQYTNTDPRAFLDAMAFWDANHGLVIGDAVEGHLHILTTSDGGASWSKIADAVLPPALPGEGAFSASGSNIAMMGSAEAWIAMGSRVLHTADRGKSWSVAAAPLAAGESAGIFSIAFRDSRHGVIVGGDYKNENAAQDNIAITDDGGKTWSLVREHGLSGYRSAVKYLPNRDGLLVAVGPTGADLSRDDGKTWTPLAYPASVTGFDALSFAPGLSTAWATGNKGGVARLQID